MKHKPGSYSVGGWTATDFKADCKVATAFHLSAHGVRNGFQDDAPSRHMIYATDLERYFQARLPITDLPPVHIVFAASCSTTTTPRVAKAFGITNDTTSPNYTNRAYIGINSIGYIRGLQAAARAFWNSLAAGDTAGKAKGLAQDAFDAAAKNANNDPMIQINPNFLNAQLELTGDSNAKLHGVYGSGNSSTAWFILQNP